MHAIFCVGVRSTPMPRLDQRQCQGRCGDRSGFVFVQTKPIFGKETGGLRLCWRRPGWCVIYWYLMWLSGDQTREGSEGNLCCEMDRRTVLFCLLDFTAATGRVSRQFLVFSTTSCVNRCLNIEKTHRYTTQIASICSVWWLFWSAERASRKCKWRISKIIFNNVIVCDFLITGANGLFQTSVSPNWRWVLTAKLHKWVDVGALCW